MGRGYSGYDYYYQINMLLLNVVLIALVWAIEEIEEPGCNRRWSQWPHLSCGDNGLSAALIATARA